MANKMMRVLSFLMIAMLAFCLMGLSLSAEQEIPVIEEVSADELATAEEEVELYAEVPEPAETDYFQVLTGETHKGYYADMETALKNAADGDTVKMLKDTTFTTVTLGDYGKKTVTIDGNGNTLTDTYKSPNLTHDNRGAVTFSNGTLIFKNINITAVATKRMEAHTQGFISISANGKVIYDAGTKIYNYRGTNGTAIWCNSSSAVAEIRDGAEISGCYSENTQGIIGTYGGKVYINGGTFKGNYGTVLGVAQASGKIYISGGTFTDNLVNGYNHYDVSVEKGYAEISGTASIRRVQNTSGDILVKSGFTGSATFLPASYKACVLEDAALYKADNTGNVKSNSSMKFLPVVNGEGTYDLFWDCDATINDASCYATLREAIGACTTASQTIILKKDVLNWAAEQVATGGVDHYDISGRIVTIDGNGHTIKASAASSQGQHRFFTVYGGGKLTVRNTTLDGNGVFDFSTVHNASDKAGTTVTFENCTLKNARGSRALNVIGGTLKLVKTTVDGVPAGNAIHIEPKTTCVNQENEVYIEGATFKNTKVRAIGFSNTGGKLYISAASDGTKTTFENCTTTGELGAAISIPDKTEEVVIDGAVFKNCVVTNQAAGAIYANFPLILKNSTFINCSASQNGGAIYLHGSAGGSLIENCTFEGSKIGNGMAGGAIMVASPSATVKNCTFKNNSGTNGGAIMLGTGKVLNLEGENTFTGNSATSGGAIYVQTPSVINLSGKLVVTENTKSDGTANNIFLEDGALINVVGNVDSESVIGIKKTYSATTIATAVDTSYVDPDVFIADDAPSGVTVSGSYFPETVGNGELNGVAVIDMTEVSERAEGRDKEIVLHWPWMVVKSDNEAFGYVSLKTAYDNRGTGVIYAQKPMTVEYQWGDELTTENYKDNHNAVFAVTEFPMWMPNTSDGVTTDVNHTDISGGKLYIDGNGHVIDAEANRINVVFVIYGTDTVVQVDNFIFEGYGQKGFASLPNSSVNKLTNTGFTANNSYFANGNQDAVKGYAGGTLTLNDTTVSGKITVGTGTTLVLNNSKIKNPNGTAIVTTETGEGGETKAVVKVNGATYINDPAGGNIYMQKDVAQLVIGADFEGAIGIDNYANQIVAGEGFGGTLESIETITQDGTENFVYYDAENDEFAFASLPELGVATDAGAYTKETGKIGVIRFATTFTNVTEGSVASYGTYALGTNNFDSDIEEGSKGLASFNVAPAAGKAYFVDVIDIPEENFDSNVYAINFVYFKGIENPWFNSIAAKTVNTATDRVKDLGEYPVTEA